MDVNDIKDSFNDFIDEHGKGMIAVLCILIFLIISALILLLAQAFKKPTKAKKVVSEAIELNIEDEFIQPQNLSLTEDYYFSRVTEESWSREATDEWFSKPDEITIKELGKANDALIEEIVGVAP